MGTATAKKVTPRLHFSLPRLPYAEDALAPVISAETLALHHGKHHKKYIDTMNELLGKTEVHGSTLEDVVRSSEGKLFNNAAQAWNHEFYWHSLAPKSAAPSAAMRRRLERDFGTYESFIDKFAAAAGPGSSTRTANSRWSRLQTPTRRWHMVCAACLRWTCGSTPITSTTATSASATCRPWSRSA